MEDKKINNKFLPYFIYIFSPFVYLVFQSFFGIPSLKNLYSAYNIELPRLTIIIINISEIITRYWFIIIPVMVLFTIGSSVLMMKIAKNMNTREINLIGFIFCAMFIGLLWLYTYELPLSSIVKGDNISRENIINFTYNQSGFYIQKYSVNNNILAYTGIKGEEKLLKGYEISELYFLIKEFQESPITDLPKEKWPEWLIYAEENNNWCCDLPTGYIEIELEGEEKVYIDINKTEYNKEKLQKIVDYITQL